MIIGLQSTLKFIYLREVSSSAHISITTRHRCMHWFRQCCRSQYFEVSKRYYTSPCYFRHIDQQKTGDVGEFRENYFEKEKPVLLSKHVFSFQNIPAATKWFTTRSEGQFLNTEYFGECADNALVPLELTQTRHVNQGHSTKDFKRFKAPLKLFLDWVHLASLQSFEKRLCGPRLYLAQANVSDLPAQLRADLPVPRLVLESGNGDVYNANIWLGLSPTNTPLHCDSNPNLFVQLAGKKIVRLLSPDDGAEVFRVVKKATATSNSKAIRGDEMMRGPENQILEEMIWGSKLSDVEQQDLQGIEALLGPGDGVFIPKGWWHSIKGIENSLTASVSPKCFSILWLVLLTK